MSLRIKETISGSVSGNAGTATTLQTARTINGTSFNGSANITTANWGTARTLTIGNTGKSVNGSANVSWSLAEIGAAATSHTHTSSQISDATNANTANMIVKRDSSGNFSAGTITASLNGNAKTATTLQTARTINGTSFNGSSNITTANWGTARTITIGSTGKSVNGSANVSWTLTEIGAEEYQKLSAATAATAQWYRIAQTTSTDQNNTLGLFHITAACSGKHSTTLLNAGITYGQNPTIVQLAHTQYSVTGISKARIVYHTTYNGNRAYLEVYVPDAAARTITVQLAGTTGWTLVTPSTVGSIPSGYTHTEIALASNRLVGQLNGNASTATTLQTARTINGTSFNGSANITTANWGTARNITIGNTKKSVNGSADVSWSLSEIGAAAASHTHTSSQITDATNANTANMIVKRDGSGNFSAGTISASLNGTASYANYMNSNTRMDYGWNGVNYFNISGTAGKAAKVNDTPTTSWWHIMRFNHANSSGYYTDLAVPFNDTSLYYKRVTNGAVQNGGWIKVLDSLNYTSFVPTKTGSGASGTWGISVSGNASTATTLQTARTINGTSFNGSANITTANWGTARTITIGSTGKSVNGSGNVSWSLSEIGAAAASHTHTSLMGTDLTNQSISLNTLNLSSGTPKFAVYFCPSDGAGANITGRPNDSNKTAFNLIVESLRFASSTDYITKQTYTRGAEKTTYVRYCTNGTWSSWEKVYTSVQKPTASEIGAAATSHTHNYAGSSSAGGNANAAVKLATARTINGTSFDGSANITTANWGTARTLTIGSTGKSVNGSGNVSWSLSEIGAAAASHSHSSITGVTSSSVTPSTGAGVLRYDYNVSSSATGNMPNTNNANGIITLNTHSGNYYAQLGFSSNGNIYHRHFSNTALNTTTAWKQIAFTTSNVSTATTLQTARTINGTSFNGSANITTANWGTARTLTIGNTGKSVNGSGNVSWSLSEIGAAAASHTHSYLPLSGGTLTGTLTAPTLSTTNLQFTSNNTNQIINTTLETSKGNGRIIGSDTSFIYLGNVKNQTNIVSQSYPTLTLPEGTYKLFNSAWTPKSGQWWNGGAVVVSSNGVSEVGKYLDFHNTNSSTADYDVRLFVENGGLTSTGWLRASGGIESPVGFYSQGIECVKRANHGGFDFGHTGSNTAILSANPPTWWNGKESFTIYTDGSKPKVVDVLAHNTSTETGRHKYAGGLYTYNVHGSALSNGDGAAATYAGYWSVLTWGANAGCAQLAIDWTANGKGIYMRSMRDVEDNWWSWKRIGNSDWPISSTSDIRYKRVMNKLDTDECYEMVKNIDLHTYLLLDDEEVHSGREINPLELYNNELNSEGISRKLQMGVIAQDLLKYDCGKFIVIQDILKDSDGGVVSDKYFIDSYSYASSILGALQKEISLRDKQILEITNKHDKLENELECLKLQLDELKSMLNK